MKIDFFIARRLVSTKQYKSSVSAPIIKIASVAVAISILMMLISVATGLGLQKTIRDKITSFNGHIIISNYDNNQSEVTTEPIALDQKFYPHQHTFAGVKGVYPFATKAGVIRTTETFEGIVYKGVSVDYNWGYIESYLTEGRCPRFPKDGMGNEVVVSSYLAQRLHLKLGDKIATYFLKQDASSMPNIRSFEIVGIFNSGFKEFDETFVLGDLRHVQRLNRWKADQIGGFEVYVDDFTQIDNVNAAIYSQLPSELNSTAITDKYYAIFEWLKLFDFNIFVILGIMIVVATINMIVALLVLILERSQMIGLLKALGASDWTIRKIFLWNATYIILKGLLWGNLIGIGLLLLQKYFGWVRLDPTQYYVTEAPVYIQAGYIVALNVGLVVVSYCILLIPSHIISRMSPVKVLKFQ